MSDARTWGEAVLVGIAWTAVAMVSLPGVLVDPSHAFWGSSAADSVEVIWTLWHVAWSLFERGDLGLFTDRAGFPDGGVLWPISPIEAVALAPLTRLCGAVVTYNVLQIAHVGLAGGATWLLVRRALPEAGRAVAWAVTPIVALSPALLCSAHNGNTEVTQVYWMLLAGGVAFGRGRHRALLAGLLGGLALIANVYVGLAAMVLIVVAFVASDDRWVARLTVAVVMAALVAAPLLGFVGWLATHPDALSNPKTPDIVLHMRLLEGAASLLDFVRPGAVAVRGPEGLPGAFFNGVALGPAALLLAVVGARRPDRWTRAWLGMGAVGVALALGPVLKIADSPVHLGARYLPLPFVLIDRLPPFRMLIELWRFSVILHVAAALLAARALLRHRRWVGVAGGVLLVEGLLLSPGRAVWQVDTVPDEPLDAVVLAIRSDPGPVAHLPLRQHTWPLYYQTLHEQPIGLSPALQVDPSLIPWVSERGWTMARLAFEARAIGYRWMVVHDRPNTWLPSQLVPDLRGAGVVRVEARAEDATVLLLDLDAVGPWPTTVYTGPAMDKGQP